MKPIHAARCKPIHAARCKPIHAARCKPIHAARCKPIHAARCKPIHKARTAARKAGYWLGLDVLPLPESRYQDSSSVLASEVQRDGIVLFELEAT
jgi:hypothetical protein